MHVPRTMETLPKSLETLFNSGYSGQVFVYPDGEHEPPCPSDMVVHLGGNVGLFRHYMRSLRHLLDSTKAELLMIHADDFRYLKGWASVAASLLREDGVGFVQTYVPRGMADRHGWGRGVHRFNGGWATSWGGGYIYTRAMADAMLSDLIITGYTGTRHLDHIIPEWAAKRGHVQLFPVPSLTAHIGMTSTIGNVHSRNENPAGW